MADTKKFLDQSGASYLWSKIKTQLDTKATVSEVNAINTKLGSIPSGVTQATFADWIAAVALAAGDATAVEALESRVGDIETDYLTSADKTELAGDISDNATDIAALELLVGDTAVATQISTAIAAQSALDAQAYADIAYETKVDTLIGSDTSKSARTIASEEVAKIVADADASYDTLKEIADWILAHPTDAAEYNSRITANENKLAGIDTTVVAYVTSAIAALSSTYAGKAYEAKVDAAETDIDNLQALHAAGTHNGMATVAEEVSTAIGNLDLSNTYYDKSAGEANAAAITTLNGDASTAGSVAKAVADAISAEVTRANAAYDASGAADAVLGSSTDTATSNTVYGAKAYADSKAGDLIGNTNDASTASTIYGAKNYADDAADAVYDAITALSNSEIDTAIANGSSAS